MPVCIYVCIVDSFNVIITAYYGKTTLKEGYYTLEKCIQQIIFKRSSSCVIFHLQCDQ